MSILCELGLGVGFYTQTHTHTQILCHLKAPTQNPYPNTQKIPHPYPYPYPNTQNNPYPYPKPIPKYSKKLRVYIIFPFFSYFVWVLCMGMGFFEYLGMGFG